MGKKLLVADDSLTIQKVIKLALSGDVYDIQTVSDGNDALQQISVFRPDAVLIDVGIPGRSAFEVKKAMNEDPDFKYIPVILMSSAFEKVDEAKVALLQFEGRLTKPFDPTHLRQALTQALSLREAYRPPEREEPSLQFSRSLPPEPMKVSVPPPREHTREIKRDVQREITQQIDLAERTKTFSTLGTAVPPEMKRDPTKEIRRETLREPVREPLREVQKEVIKVPISIPNEIEFPDMEPIALGISEESDIRHLTESTVRMSSLDEFDSWNIGEAAKDDIPHIDLSQKSEREQSFLDEHKLDFDFSTEDAKPELSQQDILPPKFAGTRSIQSLAPTRMDLEYTPKDSLGSLPPFNSQLLDVGSSNPFSMPEMLTRESPKEMAEAKEAARISTEEAVNEQLNEKLNSEETQKRIEELVRLQVEKSLELMAKKGLPDIAEKVIRQEIRRILESLN